MRELTFKGFLSQYVKELSYTGTVDLNTLTSEALNGNYRLRAPLLLYAVMNEKSNLLKSHLNSAGYQGELLALLDSLDRPDIEERLEEGAFPTEYQKVWNSFKVRHDRSKSEDDLKAAMRNKIIQLQEAKKCSNYRLYKDLSLNPGNINCWLKNGDGSKVSYQTAQRVIAYMMQY